MSSVSTRGRRPDPRSEAMTRRAPRWGCPNQPPCGHYWHDIYEPGDPYPACCEPDCRCGKPSGRLGDPVIRVTDDLLREIGQAPPESPGWLDGEILVLYGRRYRHLRRDPSGVDAEIFG